MEDNGKDAAEKKVDESWKDAVDTEKKSVDAVSSNQEKTIEVTFNLFISGLMMEALVGLGEFENPVTKKKDLNAPHAKFVIDTLAMLQEKTKANLAKDEAEMLESILYELRMRYVSKVKK